jgi:hypothetical protein
MACVVADSLDMLGDGLLMRDLQVMGSPKEKLGNFNKRMHRRKKLSLFFLRYFKLQEPISQFHNGTSWQTKFRKPFLHS